MILTKLLNNNITKNIISSNITEYDLKSAHTTALYYIKGKETYEKLLSMPKLERNITIGNMIKKEPELRKKIDELVISWFNLFLKENNIIDSNFLATTPDSILINNQLATKTKFGENNNIWFRNKEVISYSSLFIVNKREFILFDRMTNRIRIKGVGTEEKTNTYPFVKGPLKDLCCILDDAESVGKIKTLRKLKQFRVAYITSPKDDIYRSVEDHNQYRYIVDGKEAFSDIKLTESNDCILIKTDNYMNFVLPLIQSFI